jgi:glycosyltransferase involved in cell wall biosynthesis
MKILFISSLYLFKDTRFGGSKRLYYFARELSRHAEVYLICYDGCGETNASTGQTAHGEFDHFLLLPSLDTRSLLKKITTPALNTEDFLIANADRIGEFLGDATFDAAYLAYPLALSFIGTVVPGKTPVVFFEDDLLIEQTRNAMKYGFLKAPFFFVRFLQLLSYYRKKLDSVAVFGCISPQEQRIVKRYFPKVRSEIIGYGIPLEEYPYIAGAPPDFVIGFIGNFRHTPNVRSLDRLLNDIFPALKKTMPDARLLVAGKDIPAAARAACISDRSVEWKEDIAHVSEFYGAISVFVNPIVSGRGMRTKLIECAAFGRPAVSTALGAEGLEDLSIDIAETASEFAVCCGRLKNDRSYYDRIAATNRAIVEERHSLSAVGKRLLGLAPPPTGGCL